MMQVVLNDKVLYVADYPAQDGVEIIDKRSGVGAFLRDETAHRFRREFGELMAGEPDIEAVDNFIGHYSDLMRQPAVLH
jgi:integrase